MLTLLILLVIVAAVAFWGVGIYNGLVTARNAFKNAFAQIDVQLQRRFDLIPNLVEVARKYMSHERETLEAVIAAVTFVVTLRIHGARFGYALKSIRNDEQVPPRSPACPRPRPARAIRRRWCSWSPRKGS